MAPPDSRRGLGELLRQHRARIRITQRGLADRTGLSPRTLRDLEHGRVGRPRARTLRLLADGLRLTGVQRRELLDHARRDGPWIGILGPLTVRVGGSPVSLQAKPRELLGLLALHHGEPVRRAELIDGLWGERPPRTASALVHTYVARLRRLLEPGDTAGRVVRDGGGYLLRVGAAELDALRFDELVTAAAHPDTAAGDAMELLLQGLSLWHGSPVCDLSSQVRLCPAAVALAQRRVAAALRCCEIADSLGRLDRMVEPLRAVVEAEPLHEGLHARLMSALAAADRGPEALRIYDRIVTLLGEELGIGPSEELRDTYRRIRAGTGARPDRLATRRFGGSGSPAQLPYGTAVFTGRTDELVRLDEAVREERRVAVVSGIAGVGKTALALRWADSVLADYPDGQLFADLGAYGTGGPAKPLAVLDRFLRALGVPAQRVPVALDEAAGLYRTVVAGKRLLVILDDAAAADQVRPLLPGNTGCGVVVTSRDRLSGLLVHEGASPVPIAPLPYDEASALLAAAIGTGRATREPDAVTELVRACGGLPLALRIAGAKLAEVDGRAVAGYLRWLREDPLGALATADGDTAVRGTFAASYARLSSPARRLFRLLALAPGSDFSAATAAALAGTASRRVGPLLGRLTSGHLIVEHRTGRYAMHDLLRCYASELSRAAAPAERRAANDRLHQHYLAWLDAAARRVYPQTLRLPAPGASAPAPDFADHRQALAWLDAEYPSLLVLVRQTVAASEYGVASALADGLRGYLLLRMPLADWLTVAELALSAARGSGDVLAEVAAHLSWGDLRRRSSRLDDALRHYRSVVALSRDTGWPEAEATAITNLGNVARRSRQHALAADHHARALALHRAAGRPAGQAVALGNLGVVHFERGDVERAMRCYERAVALNRQVGSRQNEGLNLCNLAETRHALGQLDQARELARAALGRTREVGDRANEAETMRTLAAIELDRGCGEEAMALAERATALATEVGDARHLAAALDTLGTVQHHAGRSPEARDSHVRARSLAQHNGDSYVAVKALVGQALCDVALDRTGSALADLDQAIDIASRAGYGRLILLAEGHRRSLVTAAMPRSEGA